MAMSYFDWSGGTTGVTVPIPVIDQMHLYAYKTDVGSDGNIVTVGEALSFERTMHGNYVFAQFGTVVDSPIRFVRSTPYQDLLHYMGEGSEFDAEAWVQQQKQLLYLWQEAVEDKLLVQRIQGDTNVDTSNDIRGAYLAGYANAEKQPVLWGVPLGTTDNAGEQYTEEDLKRYEVHYDVLDIKDGKPSTLLNFLRSVRLQPTQNTIIHNGVSIELQSKYQQAITELVTVAKLAIGNHFAEFSRSPVPTSKNKGTLKQRLLQLLSTGITDPNELLNLSASWIYKEHNRAEDTVEAVGAVVGAQVGGSDSEVQSPPSRAIDTLAPIAEVTGVGSSDSSPPEVMPEIS